MGFEQDYERRLRNATWGKSLRAVAEGDAADLAGWHIERSLCDAFRRGELAGVAALAHQFRDAYQQSVVSAQLRLPIEGANPADILGYFDTLASGIVRETNGSVCAAKFHEVAADELNERHRDPAGFSEAPLAATVGLLSRFLREYAAASLGLAVIRARERRRESAAPAEARLSKALQSARVEQIAKAILTKEEKTLRAPRTSRAKPADLMNLSLVKVK